jgi:hypothetical protein
MSLKRTTISALSAAILSSCFSFGPDSEHALSMRLDEASWAAISCGDIDGDGLDDLIVGADSGASDEDIQFECWVVSSRDWEPRFALLGEAHSAAFIGMTTDPLSDRSGRGCAKLRAWTETVGADAKQHVRHEDIVLSGCDGTILGGGALPRPDTQEADASDSQPAERRVRLWSTVVDPEHAGWTTAFPDTEQFDPNGSADPGALLVPRSLSVVADHCREMLAQTHSDIHDLHACGDLDNDGVVDWLGLADEPRRALVISGRDGSVLREMPFGPDRFATVAAGMQELGDIDGDGVTDLLVVGHVSRSTERLSRRTCLLGLASIVSGADGHVLRTIEREAFVNGPGASCKRVVIPN